MRTLAFLAILLFAESANAGEVTPWLETGEVPDPIPTTFNECVRAIATDKGRENGFEYRTARFDPPLTREIHAYLEYWRREGWAKLELCGDTEQS